LKSPIICPKCGTSFIAAPLLPSKGELPQAVAKPREAPKPVAEEAEEVADVELVSLEEVEEGGEAEDETAAIADVDLGEEEESTAEGEEDNTFLVEDEEESGDVSGYLDSGTGGAKEGEEEP
jgi:uncharacterized protein (TIGR02300 family)